MDHLQQLIERYPIFSTARENIAKAYHLLEETFAGGKKLLIAGNGGSAADAEHITAELMKSFMKKRPLDYDFVSRLEQIDSEHAVYLRGVLQRGLPAISLASNAAFLTACANDISGDSIFAQQVYGYGNEGDTFLGISTSGNSKNIYYAAITAKAKNMKTIALSGAAGGMLAKYADVAINVPETDTYKIQELHLPVYHCLCLMLEERFFP